MSDATPHYGRVGKDGAEALLARLYLNAGVYTGTPAHDKCAQHCENTITRHKGKAFKGSVLPITTSICSAATTTYICLADQT